MDLRKIHLDSNERLTLKYATSKAGESGKQTIITVESPEPPTPAIVEKIKRLRVYVGEILEFPAKSFEQIEVRGISFSWHEKTAATGVIFTALRHLEKTDSPFVVNTPLKYDTSENERTQLSKDCKKLLEELKSDVITWLQSAEMQLNLFERAV